MKVKCPDSIRWLVSKKRSPYIYVISGAVVLMLLAFAVEISYQTRCEHRIRETKVYIKVVRRDIKFFFENNGKYPDSLDEFRRHVQKHGILIWEKMYVDLKLEKQSAVPEFRELNDKGGYYYNPNSGEIRLNLTRSVKEYLPRYRGRFKDEVPSSW